MILQQDYRIPTYLWIQTSHNICILASELEWRAFKIDVESWRICTRRVELWSTPEYTALAYAPTSKYESVVDVDYVSVAINHYIGIMPIFHLRIQHKLQG